MKVITLTSIVFELMTMLEMSSLLLGNKTRRGNPSIIHLNYNILPTKTTSSSWHTGHGRQFFSDHATEGGRENLSRVHSSLSDYGIHFLAVLSRDCKWLLFCYKVAKLTLIPSWDGSWKGDGRGHRDLSSMSMRDTKLNVCERHKTRRKGRWSGT